MEFWVARSFELDLRRSLDERADIVFGEFNICGGEILFEVRQLEAPSEETATPDIELALELSHQSGRLDNF
jgi:hypothetical protein